MYKKSFLYHKKIVVATPPRQGTRVIAEGNFLDSIGIYISSSYAIQKGGF